jgi:putative aminopeptidase
MTMDSTMADMIESLRSRLAELTALDGVAGFEQEVVAYLRDAFRACADEVQVDRMGNLYARRHGRGAGPHLMLEAHSDEIGGIVKSIDPQGFLRMQPLGGVSPAMLVGRRVRVRGNLGVIGVKSGHLQTPQERQSVLGIDALYIDMGATSDVEVRALGIAIGDPIAYYSPLVSLAGGDRVTGKAIDNRIGCAILLELLRAMADVTPAGPLDVVICVQEEIQLRGARVAAYTAQPDYAVVVDTFMAGDTPDVDYYREMPTAIGQGPVLLLANSAHIGHRAVNRFVQQAAESAGVPLQLATVAQGMAATDAGAIHLSRHGVPTAGIGLARRYSHTPICVLDLNDAAGAWRLLRAFVDDMEHHTDLGFLP